MTEFMVTLVPRVVRVTNQQRMHEIGGRGENSIPLNDKFHRAPQAFAWTSATWVTTWVGVRVGVTILVSFSLIPA